MDAKAWLDAAKNGELSDMKRLLQHDPSLLNESSAGIGHTALHLRRTRPRELPDVSPVGRRAVRCQRKWVDSLHAAAANGH